MNQTALAFALRQTMQNLVKPLLHPAVPVNLQRSLISKAYLTSLPPKNTYFEHINAEGLPITRVTHGDSAEGVVLYFHGGGYISGSPQTHRGITGQLARASGCMLIVPDYRLAPEHPYPAALEDAERIYRALLAEGHPPETLSLAGDSAGAGLCLALCLKLRDSGEPLPSSLTLFSPWSDLSNEHLYHPEKEPLLTKSWIDKAARLYSGAESVSHPMISPVNADLSGLPPMLIQVGTEEILLNDAERLAARAKQHGVQVTLEIYNQLWHVFQLHAGHLDRATEALDGAGEFIRRHQEHPEARALI